MHFYLLFIPSTIYYVFTVVLKLNPNVNAFHRNFINEVRRMDEMERKLRFFEEQVTKEKPLQKILNSVSLEHAGSSSSTINIDELEVFLFAATDLDHLLTILPYRHALMSWKKSL